MEWHATVITYCEKHSIFYHVSFAKIWEQTTRDRTFPEMFLIAGWLGWQSWLRTSGFLLMRFQRVQITVFQGSENGKMGSSGLILNFLQTWYLTDCQDCQKTIFQMGIWLHRNLYKKLLFHWYLHLIWKTPLWERTLYTMPPIWKISHCDLATSYVITYLWWWIPLLHPMYSLLSMFDASSFYWQSPTIQLKI